MRAAILLVFVIAVVGCTEKPPENEIRASGHVEATDVRLAPEVGGRIVLLTVKEGDRVEAGALILRLDGRDHELAVQRAKADQSQAEAQLRLLQAGSRREDISQAHAQAQAVRDELAAARAELEGAEADLQRFDALLRANAGSRKQRDDAATRRDVARERVRAIESQLRAAEADRCATQGRCSTAGDRSRTRTRGSRGGPSRGQSGGGRPTPALRRRSPASSPRSSSRSARSLRRARQSSSSAIWSRSGPTSSCLNRPCRASSLDRQATVFTDAGGSGLAGTVSYISPKAEFTPRNVQTSEERSKLVYRVRVSVDNKDGMLKQGMPVEAVIPLQALP